ncbi:MAG: DoxX family protein [Micropepsaceae bacterium]
MTNIEPQAGIMTRLGLVISKLETLPLWPIQTLARIGVAAVFYNSARLKLQSWDITLLLFRDEYQVPLLSFDLAARLATVVEMGGAVLLFVGLFSRLATLPLLGVVAIIQIFVYPNAWGEHMTWTALLLIVLFRGAGPLSIDYLLSRQFGRARVAGVSA